ncbi:MAG: tRNA lysidine(34) synthetase TilS [Micrococcales bacterium]|nr:tRNA lysidine(34) synthetase TilS [Micrococcales bacterium]
MPERPRLTPAIADVRRAVREALTGLPEDALVLVALSGGPDSLALAGATAFEAPRAGLRAGAVIVDHRLQEGSDAVAESAAVAARRLGLAPVLVRRVRVETEGGPEAAARAARYAALEEARASADATAILLGHTLDDQAETVLLGLARGSGPASLHGMPPVAGAFRRPLLGIRRSVTLAFCSDARLDPWTDPHNADPDYARVRARERVLPVLEAALGPGVAEALARTAELLREDDAALTTMAEELAEDLAEHEEAGLSLSVAALAGNPPALRHRLIRLAARLEFGVALTRGQTLEVARLVTDWHGQAGVDLPGFRAERRAGRLHLVSTRAGALTGHRPRHYH